MSRQVERVMEQVQNATQVQTEQVHQTAMQSGDAEAGALAEHPETLARFDWSAVLHHLQNATLEGERLAANVVESGREQVGTFDWASVGDSLEAVPDSDRRAHQPWALCELHMLTSPERLHYVIIVWQAAEESRRVAAQAVESGVHGLKDIDWSGIGNGLQDAADQSRHLANQVSW